jgi:hypothetical protein
MKLLGEVRGSRLRSLLLGALGFLLCCPQSPAARSELDLGGTWQYQKASQLTYPPTNTWQTTTVPGYLSGWNYERAWFRRTFTLPSAMAGQQLKLKFGGVKFNAQVWLNGAFLGSYLNGYEPFALDITSTALTGQTNELIVGVTDWTATFLNPVDFSAMPAGTGARDYVKNNLLAPIGGRYDLYGVWQPVKVVAAPGVSIADVFVMPSVRTQQLTVRLTLRNDTASPQSVGITNRVLDGATVALTLPGQGFTVPANSTAQVDIPAPWTTARCWSHLDPYLYQLETTVSGAAGSDLVNTRFGFREFWASGGKFYLNGIPINLLATATWPADNLQTTNQMAQILQDVRAGNNVAIRFHTQPWDEPWYDVADQLGILVVEEAAVWCDPAAYRLSDTNFWNNYSNHLVAAVMRDRNHPSIVLWSLENEILHCGGEKLYSATDQQLAAMGRVVKATDPTRPITYEADLDPGGQADALGLHYPHEFPDFQVWPNAAWWMSQSIARDWVPGGQWTWDHSKPLYIGEFLWVPSTSAADFTIPFGDDAYSDPAHYRNLAKGMTWKMQVEAYRSYGVNGMAPWTMFEDPNVVWGQFDLHPDSNYLYQVQKQVYAPNLVFAEEYNTRFFAGETATRTIHTFNDRMYSGDLNLRWRAGAGAWQSRAFTLPAAGQRQDSITFTAPVALGAFDLQCELSNSNSVVYTNTVACAAMARTSLTLPVGVSAGLYDPKGTTAGLLNRFGIPFAAVTDLRTNSFSQFNLLIIGRDALTNDTLAEVGNSTVASRWKDFARAGGWVLLLEQTNYPSWMPAELTLQDYDASFAFPSPDHPVMQGLAAADLRWWAGDHRVVAKVIQLPGRYNVRALASVGSHQGLNLAGAAEVPLGSGGILCSQWLLTQRFDQEPLAGLLLQRLLDYCAPGYPHPVLKPVAWVGETNAAVVAKLTALSVLAENVSGRLAGLPPALYPVLMIAGGSNAWQEAGARIADLGAYVNAGGKLVLHKPTAAFLSTAQPTLFPELNYTDAQLGSVLRRDVTNPAVRVTSDDLYWIDQAGDWNRTETLSTNVASRYYRKKSNLGSYSTIQVESMPIHTSGGASSGGWLLWANGYVAQNINVAQAGTYLFNVFASGTPVQGGWPIMTLKIDGTAQDSITVPTNQVTAYTLMADLTPGTHQLAISFDNDAYAPPEDRNLFLDQIQWGRDADNSPSSLLTRPGAVAQVRRGAGVVILDEIGWETETKNSAKAGRYACRLLTGLGGACQLPNSLTIEAETMTNVNVSAYYVSGGIAWLNSNGRIESTVRISTAGNYTFEVIAGGTTALGVFPQVAITVNGVNRTNWFLTTTAMTRYAFSLYLGVGTYNLGLAFLNDANPVPEDRNAAFDRLTLTPETAFRIANWNADPVLHTFAVQWECLPFKPYEVQVSTNLAGAPWQVATNFTVPGNVGSWTDNGFAGVPPLSPAAPQRFYRIRQSGS